MKTGIFGYGFYLSELTNGNIGFSAKAKYFYRKREDGNSTLDKSWSSPSRFYDVLRYGYLDLFLRYIDRYSIVPLSIQRTILYDLFWYIKHLQNRPERAAFLSLGQQAQFIELLDELFAHIETETILSFELAGCWFMHKVGMLNAFKGVEPPFQIAYVEDHDPVKSQILVRYFWGQLTSKPS